MFVCFLYFVFCFLFFFPIASQNYKTRKHQRASFHSETEARCRFPSLSWNCLGGQLQFPAFLQPSHPPQLENGTGNLCKFPSSGLTPQPPGAGSRAPCTEPRSPVSCLLRLTSFALAELNRGRERTGHTLPLLAHIWAFSPALSVFLEDSPCRLHRSLPSVRVPEQVFLPP